MTQRYDSSRAQNILARWCVIAEQRLDHLTELYESGRWRRYHSEAAFMENLREAKAAVETWQALAQREATLDNAAVDFSWLGRSGVPLSQRSLTQDRIAEPSSRIPAIVVHPALTSLVMSRKPASSEDESFAVDGPAGAVSINEEHTHDFVHVAERASEKAHDIRSVKERYPVLHNTL